MTFTVQKQSVLISEIQKFNEFMDKLAQTLKAEEAICTFTIINSSTSTA